jgi:hypothetical protein
VKRDTAKVLACLREIVKRIESDPDCFVDFYVEQNRSEPFPRTARVGIALILNVDGKPLCP